MKLNRECVRDLLLAIEEHATMEDLMKEQIISLPELEKYDENTIIYTAQRLDEAGYLKVKIQQFYNGEFDLIIRDITFDGHTFLDTLRDDGVWKQIKTATSTFSSVSLPVLADFGISFFKEKYGLS